MNIKKFILIFFLFTMLIQFVIINIHAYWNTTYRQIENTIYVGDWLISDFWNVETFYDEGDIVYYEGKYYIAIKSTIPKNIEPVGNPASWIFWEPSE